MSPRSRIITSGSALPVVTYQPLENGEDDAAPLNEMLVANAYINAVALVPGRYKILTKQILPSGSVILGQPGVIIEQALPVDGDALSAAFAGFPTFGLSGTLGAAIEFGDSSFDVVMDDPGPAVGDLIQVATESELRAIVFRVTAVDGGSGEYAVSVERPSLFAFADKTTTVKVINPPRDIQILGGGMRMTGTGARYVELWSGWNCRIEGIQFDGEMGMVSERLVSFDVSSYKCVGTDLTGTCIGETVTATIGLSFETAEACVFDRCHIDGASSTNILFQDAINCTASECSGNGGGVGTSFNSSDQHLGCYGCRVLGGEYNGNTSDGVSFTEGSISCYAGDNVLAAGNGVNGFSFQNGTGGAVTRCSLGKVTARANAVGVAIGSTTVNAHCDDVDAAENTFGVVIQEGASRTTFGKIDVSECTTIGFDTNTDVSIDEFISKANDNKPSDNVIRLGNGTYRARFRSIDCSFLPTTANNTVVHGVGVDAVVEQVFLNIKGGSNGWSMQGAGQLNVNSMKMAQTSAGCYGLIASAGSTVRLGSVDLDTLSNPTYFDAASHISKGVVTLNGATPVAVSWPDLKSTDRVSLTAKTRGGTPGAPPTVAYTPGTGFSVTGVAGDTSVYEYIVL